jgi:hypothetical protein
MEVNMKLKKTISALVMIVALISIPMAIPTFAMPGNVSDYTETQLTVTTIRDLPDGGKEYVYNIDGIENVFPVPPQGFNPLTASDALLKEYHFQDRPTGAEDLTRWKDVMSHYKTIAVPNLKKTNRKSILQSSASASNLNAPNWSGYINEGQTWNDVVGDYTQPSMGSGSPASSYECSWVGLGGKNSPALIQAGTGMDNDTNSYYAWYEYIDLNGVDPNNGMKKISLPIHANDRIQVEVSHDAVSLYTQFNFSNYTTGVYSNNYILQLSNNYYDSSTAEWIDERPRGSGFCYNKLTQYPNTYHEIWDYTYQPVYMYTSLDSNGNPSGNLLSIPSSLMSGTSFNDMFVASQ